MSLTNGQHDALSPLPGIIGSSPAMLEVYRITRQVARSKASVLLLGETGTGKELVAKAVHTLSDRRARPFVRVNCGALSESLLESELFGHVKGSFTGAVSDRAGRFQSADTGTIFLDEINSTTPLLQVKLLRVLQEREFERVGGDTTIRVDTRIVSASNRNLLEMATNGTFREDLYYRLNVVPIHLPPLRDRRDDIPALVGHFLNIYNEGNDRYVTHIHPAAMEALQAYDWPGNVRELQNIIEHAVVMATGDELTPDVLPRVVRGEADPTMSSPTSLPKLDFESLAQHLVLEGLSHADDSAEDLHSRIVDRVEREVIAQVLDQCQGVQIKAASRLGINRNTLHKKIKDYGLGE
ncbi:sigma-54 interaction domain-containing protein [Aeoliella sp. SH292]|uniref:sigma-54 interaction domain-containing protein n=1 Tax=Aeoliella sp. SH292 TaxID=3454464 RepID=UPI003F9B7EB1